MPLQQTSGAASYDAFGGGAPVAAKYIEDFFQSWLRTGTGSSTTVTTGLNASINKSLVWTKSRSAATNHKLTDNVRGATKALSSNTTGAEVTDSQGLTAFSSTGYTIGTNTAYNNSGATYVDFQWVATPKFFDVVTYTGNGGAQTISHNLGSVPGCIIIKNITSSVSWIVYHQNISDSLNKYLILNDTASAQTASGVFASPTSTTFGFSTSYFGTNASGEQYVAYVFAHNAGGFGLTGTDNVISCGSFTTDASGNATVNLGYEPQWLLSKTTNVANSWDIVDVMRSWPVGPTNDAFLYPNNSNAEFSSATKGEPTSTGFNITAGGNTLTYIYIAIRRGPMRTPTTGTSVFAPVTQLGASFVNAGFPVDFNINTFRNISSGKAAISRLTNGNVLETNSTAAEGTVSYFNFANQNGIQDNYNSASQSTAYWNFRRAPGFFDVVCYTGTGSARTVAHNLTVAPELIFCKSRSGVDDWSAMTLFGASTFRNGYLNTTLALPSRSYASNAELTTQPTATTFTLGTGGPNASGSTYVAYLFASCPGVSKVGSYTGTAAPLQIDCGFTAGSRFVLIKRTDATGSWFVWDSARGIVAGNDPYLLLNNNTAAENTSNDYIDPYSAGFELPGSGTSNPLNISGGTYIFLAIA